MSIFATAADWLARQRNAHAAMPAVYRRGDAWCPLRAAPGRTRYEQATAEGATIEASRDDWILQAADLVLGGQLAEPERGDRLEVNWPDGRTRTYEVLPLADGQRCFALDPHRVTFRVHAREVASC